MNPIVRLETALAKLRQVWGVADATGAAGSFAELPRTSLASVGAGLSELTHQAAAQQALWAAQVSRESGRELGAGSLAKQHGFRNATHMVAVTFAISTGDAARLIKVGEATTPRMTLTGDVAPAQHPHIADAMCAGTVGITGAMMLIEMLDRVIMRAGKQTTMHAEQVLCEQAVGLTLAQLAKLIARAEAWLDPDGVEPTEQELRAMRTLTITERDGMVRFTGVFDPETAAPIKTAIEGIVNHTYRAKANLELSDDNRTFGQIQADALATLCTHALGCDNQIPTDGAQTIIRVSLDDLRENTGFATIDGINQPISISTARRLSATGGIIPLVLGSESEILDQGRLKRHFTKAQKLALVERDGGCAMCGLPPTMCQTHHINWWSRGGTSNLSNGILLCSSCHHRIHDNNWEIRIDDTTTTAKVWFIPPPHIDPTRTPRPGAKAKYDYNPAA